MLLDESDIAKKYKQLLKNATTSYHVADAVKDFRDNRNFQWNISPHRQEDIHEGFILMMEALGDRHNYLFNTRYQQIIYCSACKKDDHINVESCPTELVIEVNEPVHTQQEMESYIKKHHNIPEDYRCEHCGARNDGSPTIYQFYQVARLSSIIILLFKGNQDSLLRYGRKHTQYYPERLEFTSKTGPIHYQLVARAEQFGSLHGGHYTADVLRDRIYHCNDSSISSGSFEPSSNTYMVFYHLI